METAYNDIETLFEKAIQAGDWSTALHLVKYVGDDGQGRIIDAVNRGQGD